MMGFKLNHVSKRGHCCTVAMQHDTVNKKIVRCMYNNVQRYEWNYSETNISFDLNCDGKFASETVIWNIYGSTS